MQSLERIAKVRELASQELVVPSKWSLEVCDAAEAWAKLVAILERGYVKMKHPIYSPDETLISATFQYSYRQCVAGTPEAAVAALFDKIGGTDAKCD